MRAHSSISSASLERFCAPPVPWTKDHSKQYDPARSSSWNTFTLSNDDFDDNFIVLIHKLHALYRANKLKKSDFDQLALTFAIPCYSGEYNLIPNGLNISVNVENAGDYFHRVEAEFIKLREQAKQNVNISGSLTACNEQSTTNRTNIVKAPAQSEQWNKCIYRTSAHSCPVDIVEEEQVQEEVYGRTNDERLEELEQREQNFQQEYRQEQQQHVRQVKRKNNIDNNNIDDDAVLNRNDMHFLNEFQTYAETMLRVPDVSEEAIKSLDLRWCIVVPKKNCSILLRPHGNNIIVNVNEFHEYLHAVVRKINEIRTSIMLFNRYPSAPSKDSDTKYKLHRLSAIKASTSSTPTILLTSPKSYEPAITTPPEHEWQQSNQELDDDRYGIDDKRNGCATMQITANNKIPTKITGSNSDAVKTRTQLEIEHSLEQRAKAQPLPATAYERSLFSPTHTSGNLFAPPQHLNV